MMKVDIEKVSNNEKNMENYDSNDGKDWPQILAVCAVSLGSLTLGIIYVWTSPFALVITQDKENYDITEEEASYFMVFQPVGMIFASLFFFKVAELLGRKKSVLLIAVPQLLSWITVILAKDKWAFYFSRFLGGCGDCFLFCSVPPYIGEITTPSIRGFLGNLPTFLVYAGQLLITVMGSYLSVKLTAYICMVLPIIFLVLVAFLPESPYQLIRDGKYDEAKKSIKWLRRKPNIEEDFYNMKKDVERQMSENGNWKDLFTIKSNRRALRAGVLLRFSQQLSGTGVFATYTQPIFEKAGGSLNAQYSSMIYMGIMLVLNLVCSLFIDKLGRRLSYFYSILTSALILLPMALYFFLEQFQLANLDNVNWFPLAGMIGYVITFSLGLGIVPTLMLGELFSASVKPKGLAVLVAVFGLSIFATTNVYNLLVSYVGLYGPFLVYGICCLISSILTLRWVPETKGKTLEEIQQDLKK